MAMNSDRLAARIGGVLGSSLSSRASHFASRPPPPIPDHEIIASIGAGGYGEVWLARSVTGAMRAVKVVWRDHFSSERPYEREFRGIVQFEPISRSHPGVVNVLHVGRDDAAGCFYYVMELAEPAPGSGATDSSASNSSEANRRLEGYSPRTLASELKSRRRLPVTDVVSLGVQLAGALGHLHRHGLVHRDVKPSNVIFVGGQAKLADIGLVTSANEERSFVGTDGFIPPEGPGSERADLFALGRLLYEAATGIDRREFPALPEDLDQWPGSERQKLIELNEVLARACAPDAKRRHSNAADLAGDLNLILAGRSVRRAYRVERQVRQATLVSVAAIVLVLLAVFSNWLQRRQSEVAEAHARREARLREEAQQSLARAEAAERNSQVQLYAALLEQARATVLSREAGQRVRALDALRRAALISKTAELRREVMAALSLPDLKFEHAVVCESDVTQVQLDPSFERFAAGRSNNAVEIRSVADNRVLATLPASTNLPSYHREWSADGRFLAVKRDYPGGGRIGDWEIWDVANRERIMVLRRLYRNAFAFHPRKMQFIACTEAEGAAIWDLESRRELVHFPQVNRAHLLRYSPEGDRFASVSSRAPGMAVTVHAADLPTLTPLAVSPVIDGAITTVAWHPEGRWLVVPDHGAAIQWMDARTGEMGLIGRHKRNAVRAVFSRDGNYLFTGGWGGELICWNAQTKQRQFDINLNSDNIQLSADGARCALLTKTTLHLYHFETPAAHRDMAEDLGGFLDHAAFSPDGRWLAGAGDKHVAVWDQERNGPAALTREGSNSRLFFAANGRELFATRIPEGTPVCYRWSITPATNAGMAPAVARLPLEKPAGFLSLSVSSNSVVITGSNGSRMLAISELESPTGAVHRTHVGINGASPDGRWLGIYRSFDRYLYVYRLPTFERVAKLPHPTSFSSFEFSPLGGELAVGSLRTDALVQFWNTSTWERTRTLTNFGRVLYTGDARTFWLTKDERNAGLYDARTLEPLLLLPTGTLPLALGPNGRYLAATMDGRRLRVWDLQALREQFSKLGLDWALNR